MYLKNKRVLVLGLGITGSSTVEALEILQAEIIVSDTKPEEELKEFFEKTSGISMEKYLNTGDLPLDNIDLIVKSPGVPPEVPILIEARKRNIEIITDIELAYRISPTENLIAITGTNGKTTCTALLGEIFRKAKYNTYIAGNIGIGILGDMIKAKKDDVFVIEASSFQLENTVYFQPKISLITNITMDHLDWHGTLDKYINAKKKIFANQNNNDYIVLNYDDLLLREMQNEIEANIIWFSVNEEIDEGVCIVEDYILIKSKGDRVKILPYKDVRMPGKHNLENVLGCIGVAWAMNIETDIIAEVLKEFPGVEHRIEFVRILDGISFYNDSKGTNPDSTMKAIEALAEPIILIAGGYDKGSEFEKLIGSFNSKVKELILLGETKEKIRKTAIENNFTNVHLVKTMKEAVNLAWNLAGENDNILLSPACASWGMYSNFEERGKDFKNAVYCLGED